MVPVDATGASCIDRWEAHVEVQLGPGWSTHSPYDTLDDEVAPFRAASAGGVVPQGYISGVQARAACEASGKRLCTATEYRAACRGPDDRVWPYGDTRIPGACNEGRATHPVIELFGPGTPFDSVHMNDPLLNQLPDSLAKTGSHPQCQSPGGALDLAGNLHEWVDDPGGTFLGGFYVDAVLNGEGCKYTTTAHAMSYHDYSTGFRCCW